MRKVNALESAVRQRNDLSDTKIGKPDRAEFCDSGSVLLTAYIRITHCCV